MRDRSVKLVESTLFMAGMTALGGFCNAYTCMTRGGVFANAHTANMAKLGIPVATLDLNGAFNAIVPILGCLLGSILCEFVKARTASDSHWLGGHWHQRVLAAELVALLIVGFVPATVPHFVVNAFMSLVTGFQLDMFRTWKGSAHNTTICTGNLRTLGQLIYAAASKREPAAIRKMRTYAGLMFSFSLGAVISTLLCLWLGVRATWAACLFLAVWLVWMFVDERRCAEETV